MYVYKIYCGLNDRFGQSALDLWPGLVSFAVRTLNGCLTVYNATGYWHGGYEQTNVIEYIGDGDNESGIYEIADEWKRRANQDSVLVTKTALAPPNKSKFSFIDRCNAECCVNK